MLQIKGYKINNSLFSDGSKTVLVGFRESDSQAVVLKVIKYSALDYVKVIKLKREFDLLSKLKLMAVPEVLEFIEFKEGVALVMKYEGYGNLKEYAKQKEFSIIDFLKIAIQLAEALAELHKANIVHKDIKPDNIIINPDILKINLIDFGNSIQISEESVGLVSHRELEGTLHYISPEQTGRMNRSIDFRSDFYSLGISLYEIATGVRPFDYADAIEIIHAHLALPPKNPIEFNPKIPSMVGAIILKLLEKSPENRYQSALGLKFDLNRCLEEYLNYGEIESFRIGSQDYSDRFRIPQFLYGRESELELLLNAFYRVANNSKELVIVSGFSGIGKTSLIQEIQKPVTEKRSIYIAGKFDQFQKDMPYLGIKKAFSGLIRQILSESEETVKVWQNKFLNSLGSNGNVISEVIPDFELIIGNQPEITQLPPAESQNRFNLFFLKFVQCIATKESPLVLFLDDLQWADSPSLKLFELILCDDQTKHMLIIGSYRDNEVNSTHQLLKTLLVIKNNGIIITDIKLEPLKFNEVNNLVSDTLRKTPDDTFALSSLILKKTNGNPFFINQFLKNLYQLKLIYFDYDRNSWNWDVDQIEKQDITDNVVELMRSNLKLLDDNTQKLCELAACIGNVFELKTLATIYEASINETAKVIFPAIQAGLIIPIGNEYRLAEISDSEEINSHIFYRFLHDRVQQAAYSSIDPLQKQAWHLNIGKLLYNSYSIQEREENIFDLLNQYNHAITIINDLDTRIELAKLNLFAGKKAKASSAYEPAYNFLKIASEFLPKNAWVSYYDLTLAIYSELAEGAYLTGGFNEMEDIFINIFNNAKEVLHTTNAYIVKIQAYLSLGDFEKSLGIALEALNKMQLNLKSDPNKLDVIVGLLKTKFLLRNKTPEMLENMPLLNSQLEKAQMLILSASTSSAYFVRPNLFPLIIFKQIEISVKYGNSPDTSFAYSTYGLILCGSTNEFDEGENYGQLAIRLVDKYDLKTFYSRVHYVNGNFILHWKHHYNSTYETAIESFNRGMETGEYLWAAYSTFLHTDLAAYAGMPLPDLINLIDYYLPFLQKMNQKQVLNWQLIHKQFAYNFHNAVEVNCDMVGDFFNENIQIYQLEQAKDFGALCNLYLNKLMLHYFMGTADNAIEFGTKANNLIENVLATPQVSQTIFYHTLSMLKGSENLNGIKRWRIIQKVKKNIKKIKLFAAAGPMNHQAKLYLVEAELNRINKISPISLYNSAIKAAHSNQILHEEALSHELLGRFYQKSNEIAKAKDSLLHSRSLYLKWGANAKVRLLDEEFELILRTNNKVSTISKSYSYDNSFSTSNTMLDMESIIKSSIAISSEIVLDDLLSKLMKIVIENAGAQNGYFLLEQSDTWKIMVGRNINDNDGKPFQIVNLIGNQLLPENVVNYVIRTKQDLVFYDIQKETVFSRDPVSIKLKLNSVLCIPILNQGKLIGILYLENSLNSGVFTDERVRLIKLLSGQIAVSLKNAMIYEDLEQKVKERTIEIEKEKAKSEKLLLNILPFEIAHELKQNGFAQPKRFDSVSVMFTDFVNFSKTSEELSAVELVEEISFYYSTFDKILIKHSIEKIKTIGDSYMCAGGLPNVNFTHSHDIVKAALEMKHFIAEANAERRLQNKPTFECRIGIHTGPVVAGIVGIIKFAYDIWGDTVNIASRMEQNGASGKINISESTYSLVKDFYPCEYRGEIEAKNKGKLKMYFIKD
jgi:predicted ATPase/class 3 adenylate cyclase